MNLIGSRKAENEEIQVKTGNTKITGLVARKYIAHRANLVWESIVKGGCTRWCEGFPWRQ